MAVTTAVKCSVVTVHASPPVVKKESSQFSFYNVIVLTPTLNGRNATYRLSTQSSFPLNYQELQSNSSSALTNFATYGGQYPEA